MGYVYTTNACFGSKYSSFHLPDLVVVIEYFRYDGPIRQLTPSTALDPGSADHWSRLGMSFLKYAVIQRAWTCATIIAEIGEIYAEEGDTAGAKQGGGGSGGQPLSSSQRDPVVPKLLPLVPEVVVRGCRGNEREWVCCERG
jgi:hypothetical protein